MMATALFSAPACPISLLSVEELKALKTRWYEEAKSQGVLSLLNSVGRHLGRDLGGRYGPKYEWISEDESIRIYVDAYGGFTTVQVNGRSVCSSHETEYLFVPGPWLDQILCLQKAVDAKKREKQLSIEEQKRRLLVAQLAPFDEEG